MIGRLGGAMLLVAVLAQPAAAGDPTCTLPPGACEEPTEMRRPFAIWKPWALAGGGVALVGAGVLLRLAAVGDLRDYEDAIARECGGSGCAPDEIPPEIRDLESRANLENGLAIGALLAGGAAVIAGVVFVIYDYPRPVPVVSRDTVGLALEGRF